MMKKILFFISLFFIPLIALTQDKKEIILDIRAEFQRINASNELEVYSLLNEEFLDHIPVGGGELKGYFENGQLVKYTVWLGVSYGNLITDYYYKNGALFFAFEREKRFKSLFDDSGEWMYFDTSQDLSLTFEGRYYFHLNKLVKEILKGEKVTGDAFSESEFLKNASEFAEILMNHHKK